MKFIKYIIILIIFIACKNSNNINSKSTFLKEIEIYIRNNPLKPPVYKNIYKKGFSYPSYHIYFNKKDNDTLMSVIQSPHLSNVEIDGTNNIKNNEIIYNVIKPDGIYWYKEKYPLILFNSKYYKKENLIKYLKLNIPDSLKFNEINYHIKPNRWDYKITNNKIRRIK